MVGVDAGQIGFHRLLDESAKPGYGIRAGYQYGIWNIASVSPFLTIQNEFLWPDFIETLEATYSIGMGIATKFGFGFRIGKVRLYPFLEYDLAFSFYLKSQNNSVYIVQEETIGTGLIL